MASNGELKNVFYAFTSFGASERQVEMDGKAFVKLCKDTKLTSKALSTTELDLIFAKVKSKGARKISYDQFLVALDEIAAKKGCALADVVSTIVAGGGPTSSGTVGENVRLHDDKSTYTGVYAKGGPTNVDCQADGLAGLCDRSSADVRGVKHVYANSPAGARRSTGDTIPAAGGRRSTTGNVSSGGSANGSRRATTEAVGSAGGSRRATNEAIAKMGKMAI